MAYLTEEEEFWATEFGHEYMKRNSGEHLVVSNMIFFSKILSSAPGIRSFVELGCNIGLNLQALNRLNQNFELSGYEINKQASLKAKELNIASIYNATILDPVTTDKTYDVSFTSGVLIHINPDELKKVYENLYKLSHRYILISEYYNPNPVTVNYRGYNNRMYKRDFAGELIDRYDLDLIDYGFIYHRDPYFPSDDTNWFLLSKK